MPRFSVVIPTYDRAAVVGRAISSVLAQSCGDFELLVADDGSRDATRQRVEGFGDPRLTYLRQENRGVSAARNLGIGAARGDIVTFLDSDGEAEPDWLGSFAEAFADPAVGVVCAGATVHGPGDDEGAPGGRVLLPQHRGAVYAGRRLRYAPPGTLAVRRRLLTEVGGYAEELRYAENAELAMRLLPHAVAAGFETVAIDRPLVRYAVDPHGWSGDPQRHALMRAGAEYVLARHGRRLRELAPRGFASYASVAAIAAARTGDVAAARRHLAAAARARPWHLTGWLRWGLTLLPPLARRFWSRQAAGRTPEAG